MAFVVFLLVGFDRPNSTTKAMRVPRQFWRRYCDKGTYFKFCGQSFWELISEDANMYIDIIEPLGYRAKERNDEFFLRYSAALNSFTLQFIQEYCDSSGAIEWQRIIKMVSGASEITPRRKMMRNL